MFLKKEFSISFDSDQFAGLTLRDRKKRATLVLFSTGTYIVVGGKREEDIFEVHRSVEKELKAINYGFMQS